MEEFSTQAFFYRLTRAIWYIFAFLEFFLGMRFFFFLLAANPNAAFAKFVYSLTDPFVAPFSSVFNSISVGPGFIDPNIILALFVYYMITWGIIRLILIARPIEHHHRYNDSTHNKLT